MRRILPAGLALLALCLSACERRPTLHSTASKLAADASETGLLAAAVPFQVLARVAFTARKAVLSRDVARAVRGGPFRPS